MVATISEIDATGRLFKPVALPTKAFAVTIPATVILPFTVAPAPTFNPFSIVTGPLPDRFVMLLIISLDIITES